MSSNQVLSTGKEVIQCVSKTSIPIDINDLKKHIYRLNNFKVENRFWVAVKNNFIGVGFTILVSATLTTPTVSNINQRWWLLVASVILIVVGFGFLFKKQENDGTSQAILKIVIDDLSSIYEEAIAELEANEKTE